MADQQSAVAKEVTGKTIKIKWVKSAIGYNIAQKRTIEALGLRRLHQVVERPDNDAVRGMVNSVRHLVEVTE
jgi:large subunit ribosomal protein L30